MFWVLLFYLLYSNGSCKPETCLFADDKSLAKAIKDPPRLDRVIELRGQADVLLEQQVEKAKIAVESLRSVTARHDAGAEQFHQILAELDQDRERIQAQLLNVRFQMKEQMTEKEWQKAYGKPK